MQNSNVNEPIEIAGALDEAGRELYQLAALVNEELFNTEPFAGSWTPAQLLVHVTKSNNGIAQGMEMEGKPAGREPVARVAEFKKILLDFDHKLQSPVFILPKPGQYNKAATIAALLHSNENLKERRQNVNLPEVITFEVLGEITKLELLYFVLYHTQRHINQLKKMIASFPL